MLSTACSSSLLETAHRGGEGVAMADPRSGGLRAAGELGGCTAARRWTRVGTGAGELGGCTAARTCGRACGLHGSEDMNTGWYRGGLQALI